MQVPVRPEIPCATSAGQDSRCPDNTRPDTGRRGIAHRDIARPDTTHMNTACLVLAAGRGSRLGGGKLLLPWQGRPIILHVLETLGRIPLFTSITVVLGYKANAMQRAIAALPKGPAPLYPVENPHWHEGQSASLRAGLEAVAAGQPGPDCVLVALGDQPLVQSATIEALLAAHACRRPLATAPQYRGQRGNPVIFSRSLFPRMLEIRGDKGARDLLAALGEGLLPLPVDDPGVVFDVDTQEAYQTLQKVRKR